MYTNTPGGPAAGRAQRLAQGVLGGQHQMPPLGNIPQQPQGFNFQNGMSRFGAPAPTYGAPHGQQEQGDFQYQPQMQPNPYQGQQLEEAPVAPGLPPHIDPRLIVERTRGTQFSNLDALRQRFLQMLQGGRGAQV